MLKTVKQLERNLGYKIRRDIFCLGIDTATKSGVAWILVKKDKVKIETSIMKIPSIPRDTEDKASKYEECLRTFHDLVQKDLRKLIITKCPEKTERVLVLENSFLSINPWTYGYLKVMLGILYAELSDMFNEIHIIFPTTARKNAGFHSTLPRGTKSKDKKKEIMTFVSNIVQDEIKDDNCADALILCLNGVKA